MKKIFVNGAREWLDTFTNLGLHFDFHALMQESTGEDVREAIMEAKDGS